MARWFPLAGVCCIIFSFVGCSNAPSRQTPLKVSGTVNLDGKPLADGSITFADADGSVPDKLDVIDGKFEGKASPGKKRVEIRAYKMGQETKMGEKVIPAQKENYLPASLNTQSKLTAEITASGVNPNKFDVASE